MKTCKRHQYPYNEICPLCELEENGPSMEAVRTLAMSAFVFGLLIGALMAMSLYRLFG